MDNRSAKNLEGVKPSLVKVITLAKERRDFVVTEGLRTVERQKQMVKEGKSQTMNSKHITGDAVDIYCGSWDPKDFLPALIEIYKAGQELGVKLRFGCNWANNPETKTTTRFKDWPHVELV